MKLLRSLGGMLSVALLLGILVFSAPAGAQSLTALSLERSLALNNILTTFPPPPVPAATLAAIAAGAVEIREQINFNAQSNTLTATIFLVPSGAPNPTNLGLLPFSAFVVVSTTAIDKIYIVSKPVPSVTIVGTVIQTNSGLAGGISTLSFGYSSDKPPKISNVVETVGGFGVLYSASSLGTFTITQPTTGGGGGTAGITVVVNGATVGTSGVTLQTTSSLVTLDPTGSKSTNAGALTFSWSVAPGAPSASISVSSSGVAQIQLGSGKGTYIFVLKVTDSTGASSTVNVTIQFI